MTADPPYGGIRGVGLSRAESAWSRRSGPTKANSVDPGSRFQWKRPGLSGAGESRAGSGEMYIQLKYPWYAISRDSRENIGLGPFPRNEKTEMPLQAGLSGLRILFRQGCQDPLIYLNII
ncbi:hypothetical protein Taro_034001 [Colocasia esculenta]|uniref:Uncharacterized protein n=1 Tax=Colocasia esculenta TaxID=4460 RepID=A0A843W2X3_COLES|nr:hypothetical protein [Colocasia esculenta]